MGTTCYAIIEIAGYWRVMRDRKLVSTHRMKRSAEAAMRRLQKADARCAEGAA